MTLISEWNAHFARQDERTQEADQYEVEISEGPGKRFREQAKAEVKLRKTAFENSKKAFRVGRKAEARRVSKLPLLCFLHSDHSFS